MPAAPEYIDYGWLRLGNSLWATPGMLEIHQDTIALLRERILWQRRYVVPRSSIRAISQEQFFWFMFSGGLRVEHSLASYPPFLFWSRDIEALTVQLQPHGYSVSTTNG